MAGRVGAERVEMSFVCDFLVLPGIEEGELSAVSADTASAGARVLVPRSRDSRRARPHTSSESL